MPYDPLLPRVQRFAMREFSREPGLSMAAFERRLGETFFSNGKTADHGNAAVVRGETPLPRLVADLLDLQRIWNFEADWYWSSPLLDPAFLRRRAQRLNWPAEKRQAYQRHFERLSEIAARYADSANPAAKEMGRLAGEIVKAWGDDFSESGRASPAIE